MSYAFSGVMSVVTDSSTFVLPPNRAIWIPAGCRHMVSCRGDVSLNVLYIDPTLPGQPDVCRVFDVPLLARALIQEILTFPHEYDETGREGRIVQSADRRNSSASRRCRSRRRCRATAGFAEFATRSSPTRPTNAILTNLPRSPAWAGEPLHARFRDETGMAFAMWRQQIRLMAAISMLGEGQSITNIAYEVGYESPSSFTAMFHRVLGVAPSHYGRDNRTLITGPAEEVSGPP